MNKTISAKLATAYDALRRQHMTRLDFIVGDQNAGITFTDLSTPKQVADALRDLARRLEEIGERW